jgi:hypothetical protein
MSIILHKVVVRLNDHAAILRIVDDAPFAGNPYSG